MQSVRTEAITGTRDWTEVSTIFRTGDSPTELEINCLLGGWGESTGQAWFDDISLQLIDDIDELAGAVVTVDEGAKAWAYSPMIFGGFIEHFHRQIYGGIYDPGSEWSDGQGFRRDVIEALKELKVSVVRWPGGCFASGYHWRDGVGPVRRPVPDPVWGVVDSNAFGTDEFWLWCARVGARPYICTNAGNGTPEEMRDWVLYCNGREGAMARLRQKNGHEQPLNVRYWSIGNENWGGHEIGARTPAEWGPLVRRCAELMLEADPELVLLAAATPDRNWTLPLLKEAGAYLDYVCIHGYWLGNWEVNATPDYLSCIMQSEKPEQTIVGVARIVDEAGFGDKIKIAFDEWNLRGWHHPGFPRKVVGDRDDIEANKLIAARDKNAIASQYSMADALFSASFLNACLRHAEVVGMANIAPIVNTRGPLYVHSKGVLKRTTFHVLSMYANLLESEVVAAQVRSGMLTHASEYVAMVDGVVTRDASGRRWALALVNRHPEQAVECRIQLEDRVLDGVVDATVLSGDSPDAYNDLDHPERVIAEKKQLPVRDNVMTLGPHSLTIVKVE